jgi:exodeoxyribonuclease III
VKLATWNVNSLGVRLPHVLQWLSTQPMDAPIDVLGLQELKLTDDKFPFDALHQAGYVCEAFGEKTYNGVALLSRTPLRDVVRNIPGYTDVHARVIAATVDTPSGPLRVVNGYFVNGQAPGSEKFEYKMSWLRGLRDYVRSEMEQHPQLLLMGDYNITPEDRDSYDPVGLHETIHHTTQERDQLRKLLELGLTDSFRMFEQPDKSFSWWDYRMLGYQKNKGLRIDHILVSHALTQQVQACMIDRVPRKWEKPSDHAPVVITLS